MLLQEIELERDGDDVYVATTRLISAVMNMTKTAADKHTHLYVPLVKVRACRRLLQSSEANGVYGGLQTCLAATGTYVPYYGITQCYLPPGIDDISAFTPSQLRYSI